MDAHEWNTRYASAPAIWSPHPNRILVERCPPPPTSGRSLDLGCGEGGDTRWLAQQGWSATGVDFSAVAVERARQHSAGMPEPAPRYEVAEVTDLETLHSLSDDGQFELVTASYLHPEAEDRARTFAPLADLVAVGGHLFLLSHHPDQFVSVAGGPGDHGCEHHHGPAHEAEADPADGQPHGDAGGGARLGGTPDSDRFGPAPERLLTPEQMLAALSPDAAFEVITAEVIRSFDPTGALRAVDSLVLLRRRTDPGRAE